MSLTITIIISVWLVTLSGYGLNSLLKKWRPTWQFCPMCFGVSVTWLWLLVGLWLGYDIPIIWPAILMGGSVVGLTNWLEKRRPDYGLPVGLKVLLVTSGFIAVYFLLAKMTLAFLADLLILILLVGYWLVKSKKHSARQDSTTIKNIEKEMEKCC